MFKKKMGKELKGSVSKGFHITRGRIGLFKGSREMAECEKNAHCGVAFHRKRGGGGKERMIKGGKAELGTNQNDTSALGRT